MDGDIRRNTYDDGSKDFETGEQRIRNFNINFGPQHPAAHGVPCVNIDLRDGFTRLHGHINQHLCGFGWCHFVFVAHNEKQWRRDYGDGRCCVLVTVASI